MLITEEQIRKIIRKNLIKEKLLSENNGTTSTLQNATPGPQVKNYNSLPDVKYWNDLKKFKINNYSFDDIEKILIELKKYYKNMITNTQWNSSLRGGVTLDFYKQDYPELCRIVGGNFEIQSKNENNEAGIAQVFNSLNIDFNNINNLNKFKFDNIDNTIVYDLFFEIFENNNTKKKLGKELNIVKSFYFKYIENLFKSKGLVENQIEEIIEEIKNCDRTDDDFKEVLLFPLDEFEFDNKNFSSSLVEFQTWVNKSKINSKPLDKSYFFKKIYPLTTKPGISIYGPGKSEFVVLALIKDSTSGGGKSHDIVFKGANAGNEIELKQGNQKFVSIQLNIKKEEEEDEDKEDDEEEAEELEEDSSTIYEDKKKFNDSFNKFQNNFKNYTSEINEIFELSNSLSQKIWENYIKTDGTSLKPAFIQSLYPGLTNKPKYLCSQFIQEISTFVSQNLNKYKAKPPSKTAIGPSRDQIRISREAAKNFNELFSNEIIGNTDEKIFSEESMKKMSEDFLKVKGASGKKIFILGKDNQVFEDPDDTDEKIPVFTIYDENNDTHRKFKNLFMSPEDLYQLIRKKMERINLYRKDQISTMIQINKTDLSVFLGYYVENVFNIQLMNLEYFNDHLEKMIQNKEKLADFKIDKSQMTNSTAFQKMSAIDNFIHKVKLGNEELRITFKKYDSSSKLVKEKEIISNINNFKIVNPADPSKDIKIDDFLDTNKNQSYSLVFNDIEISHESFQKIINQKNMFSYLYPETISVSTTTSSKTGSVGNIKAPQTQNLLKDIDDLLIKLLDIHISIEESYSKGGKGALAYSGENIEKLNNKKISNGILADSFKVVFPNPDNKYRGVYKKIQDRIRSNNTAGLETEITDYKNNNVPFINKLGARDLSIDSNNSPKSKSFLEIILELRKKIIDKQAQFNKLLAEINTKLSSLT